MTPHLNRLDETVQMRGHNICFHAELTKIITNYLPFRAASYSSSKMYTIYHEKTSGLYLIGFFHSISDIFV